MKRRDWALLAMLVALAGCAEVARSHDPLTSMLRASECDFGVLRVTRSMRCDDEFRQRGWQ